jgi:hypothetical protein
MALAAERAIGERHQGKRAAFAFIVGAEQDEHVFDGDDEEQRPDDERQNAQDHRLGRALAATGRRQHGFAQGIEGARADVAIDDADASKRQRPKIGPSECLGGRAVSSRVGGEGVWHLEVLGRKPTMHERRGTCGLQ